MKRIITIAAILFFATAGAMAKGNHNDDSSHAALIEKGSRLLKKQMAQNELISTGRASGTLNYIINVDGGQLNQTDQPITTETQVNGFKGFFSPDNAANAAALANFNNKLTALNSGNAIKAYCLLINGFNVEYRDKLPDSMKVSSVFNDSLIDKNTDMLGYQKTHDELATAIYNNAFGLTGNQNSNVMVFATGHYHLVDFGEINYFSKVQELYYCKVFPDYFMGLGDPRQHMADLFTDKLKELTTGGVWKTEYGSAAEIMDLQLQALESAYKKYLGKKALLTTYTVSGIKTIVENYTAGDFASLRKQERLHILSVLVAENMFGNWGVNGKTNEEALALNILNTVPASDAESMLTGLKNPSTVATDPAYIAANGGNAGWNNLENTAMANTCLLRRLIRGVDDGPLGTRYAELIVAIKKLCMASSKFGERYLESAENFDKRLFSVGKPANPYPGERIFDDASIRDNGEVVVNSKVFFPAKNTNKKSESPLDFLNLPPGLDPVKKLAGNSGFEDAQYFGDLGDHIGSTQSGLMLLGPPPGSGADFTYTTESPITLDPYDLVLVTVNNNMESVKDGAGQAMDNAGKQYSVPAVFLYYTKDKLRNHTLATAARITADVLIIAASLGSATPGVLTAEGALETAEAVSAVSKAQQVYSALRRGFAVYNGLLAVGDLALIISGIENDPEYKEYVKWFQYAQILGAGGEMGVGLVRTDKGFLQKLCGVVGQVLCKNVHPAGQPQRGCRHGMEAHTGAVQCAQGTVLPVVPRTAATD
jgi:hypothetical protein